MRRVQHKIYGQSGRPVTGREAASELISSITRAFAQQIGGTAMNHNSPNRGGEEIMPGTLHGVYQS